VFAIAVSILTRIAFVQYGTFYFTLARLDGLAIGSAVAIFARDRGRGLVQLVPWAKRVVFVLAPMLGVTQLIVSGSHLQIIQALKSTVIAFVYASFLTLVLENRCGRIATNVLSGRALGSIGKYSYGMYVFHPFIIWLLRRNGLHYGPLQPLFVLLLTTAVASLSWNVFEKRFTQLKSFFEYSSQEMPRALAIVSVEARGQQEAVEFLAH
jgi:peptidoglycan/LPS O-acetylase OafA/YrhL